MWKTVFAASLSFLFLLLGSLVYLCARDHSSMLVSNWVRAVGLQNFISSCQVNNERIPGLVLYVLPDMLWVSAFTIIFTSIWHKEKSRYFWMCAPLTLAVTSEVGQKIGWVSGTYDTLDIMGYVLGWLSALALDALLNRTSFFSTR
jgi:hypothetical protein